jgi:hypothetical protein
VVSPVELRQSAQGVDIDALAAQIDARISHAVGAAKPAPGQKERSANAAGLSRYAAVA